MIEHLIPGIRNAVRAVITSNGSVLLQRKVDDDGTERYTLPGGAQEQGERLADALQRECEEEIGARVKIIDLMFVGDYFRVKKTDPPTTRHLLEFLFACTVDGDYQPANGPHPDRHQVDVVWMPIENLTDINLVPADYIALLQGQVQSRIYVGQLY
jgi:ADP-ribose pyrophosphatase YjhB (NUDIX family)